MYHNLFWLWDNVDVLTDTISDGIGPVGRAIMAIMFVVCFFIGICSKEEGSNA